MAEEIVVGYEDEDLMIVSKPAFWVTTNENRQGNVVSLEDWVSGKRNIKLPRGGIVNRLDKGTSGLVLVAKRVEVLSKLRYLQEKREIRKRYWALVGGSLPLEGEIRMPVGRSRFNWRRFGVTEDGRRAITRFRRLKKFLRGLRSYSLLEIDLLTGRTHQIRVHLSYLKWPVVGDAVYGGEKVAGLERQFLHSKAVGLHHPMRGEWLEVEDELPGDLKMVLAQL